MKQWKYIVLAIAVIGIAACQQQGQQTSEVPAAATMLQSPPQKAVVPDVSPPPPVRQLAAVENKPLAGSVRKNIADTHALNKCKVCHNLTPKNKVGPGLGKGMVDGKMAPGDFGRVAGTHPGFRYQFTKYISVDKAWVWDEVHIRKWICNSGKAVKEFTGDKTARTKMPPQHVCDPGKQDAVIAALRAIS